MRGLYAKTNDYYSSFLISNIRHISSATSKSFWFGREISWLKSFPGGTSGEKPACQCRRCKRHGFDPEAWKNWCFQINAIIAQVFSADLFGALIWKLQFFGAQPSLWSSTHIHTWLWEKPQLWLYGLLSAKWYLFFNTLSRYGIAFLPRSKCLLFSLASVIIHSDFGAQENKICHLFHLFPIYLPLSDRTKCRDLSFLNDEF